VLRVAREGRRQEVVSDPADEWQISPRIGKHPVWIHSRPFFVDRVAMAEVFYTSAAAIE
jgi:hypothetical protein